MPFIYAGHAKSRILEARWNARIKRRENEFGQRIDCAACARTRHGRFVNILWSIEPFMCGSVGIAAIPPPLCVMETCTFVMHVMIETVNVIEDVGEGRLCLPSMPFRALVIVVSIQNLRDSTCTAMGSHWIVSKFIFVLAARLEPCLHRNYLVQETSLSIPAAIKGHEA